MTPHPSRRSPICSRAGGFTLAEVLVTVAVAGVMLAVGVPSLTTFIQGQRVRTAVNDFTTMLILARSEAIKRNGEVTVERATGGWANGFVIRVGNTVLMRQSAFGNIDVTNADASLVYTNTGRLKNGSSAFQIEKNSDRRCMRIDPSGMPVAREGACT